MNKAQILEYLVAAKAKTAGFLQAKGLYVLLFTSLAAVGGVAALSMGGEKTPPQTAQSAPPPVASAAPVAQSRDESLSALLRPTPSPMAPAPTPTLVPDFTQRPTVEKTPKTQKPKAAAPVKGTVLWQFAQEELIYSVTLKQWMTHAGVDVASPLGTDVHAIYAGTVEAVYEDDALGVSVRVAHDDKLATLYANLQPEVPVQIGDKVNAGDVVGKIGESARAECAQGSHLHFEVWHKDKPVDPEDYCLFES